MGLSLLVLLLAGLNVVTSINTTVPEFDLNAWWGPENATDDQDTSIRPFEIVFEDEMIEDLMYRIKNYRFSTDPLENTFRYGFNSHQLKYWMKYWVEEYSFAERVEYMNQYDHFLTNIQGLDIHFLRIPARSTNKPVIPVLMLHGWTSSFLEFYETIPYLIEETCNREFDLEFIIPSLPGFAYSDAAVRTGMGANEMAVVLRNLMHRLGHKKFAAYGGDWGSYIAAAIAVGFADEILGYISSMGAVFTLKAVALMGVGQVYPDLIVHESVADRIYPLTTTVSKTILESGYFHIQATKPDTVGIALSDSAVGWLAYILQIISMVTRKNNDEKEDGGLLEHYTEDQLIDTIMLYWAPNKITTSMRIYAETFAKENFGRMVQDYPTNVPTCIIQAPDEVVYMPPRILATKFTNMLRVKVLDEGGHFLAVEAPEVFADEVMTALQLFYDYHNNDQDVSEWSNCSI